MRSKVTFDYSNASSFIKEEEVQFMGKLAEDAKKLLVSKTGAGNDADAGPCETFLQKTGNYKNLYGI